MTDTLNEQPEPFDLNSDDVAARKRADLKRLFPEVFNEEKIDLDQLRRVMGDWVDEGSERFGLNWPGKAACMRVIQASATGALRPDRNESVNFDESENVFIEGDNLEVLKLLQKAYFGKIKMIYIDPPYNTGKEFIYPDRYEENLQTYLQYTGQVDASGKAFSTNSDTAGRFHSRWLNMIVPRLYIAKNLLRDDGVIFVSIGEDEFANLKSAMDFIFGEENYLCSIMWNSTKSVTNTAVISNSHTYNLVYFRNAEYFKDNRQLFRLPEDGEGFANPDNDPRGPWKADPFQVGGWRPNQQYEITNPKTGEVYKPNPGSSWKNEHKKFVELMADNRIVFGSSGEAGPQRKRFLSEAMDRGKVAKTWWDDVGTTTNGTARLKELFEGISPFDNPKPSSLIERFIELGDSTREGIILDFFAGSGTTGEAVFRLNKEDTSNRKFVLVQLPEPLDEEDKDKGKLVEFCNEAGVDKNLAALAIERLKRAHADLAPKKGGGFRTFALTPSAFRTWEAPSDIEAADLFERVEAHANDLGVADDDAILFELLVKDGFELTTKVVEANVAGSKVYCVAEGALLICLERNLTKEIIDALADLAEEKEAARVVCLDAGFQGNDQLKTNAVQTFKSRLGHGEDGSMFRTL